MERVVADEDEPELDLGPDEPEQPEQPEQLAEPEQPEQPDEPVAAQEAPQEQQPSRRDRRIETLTTALSEQRQRNDDLNRRLDAFLAGQNRVPQGESPEQRAQRLSLMTPEERLTETFREEREAHRRDMAQLQFTVVDGNDRAAFEAKCTVDPRYQKYKAKVEAKLAELHRAGQNTSRENVLRWVLGDRVMEAWVDGKTTQQSRGEAQRRVNAQRTRSTNSGSDVSTGRRSQSSSLEKRLENVSI